METIRIPNSATYSPVSLTDLMFAAPLASRLLIGATLPGRLVQAAAAGAYAGSVLSDWASRRGVRKIDFLETFGSDIKHMDEMPEALRFEDVERFSAELMSIHEPVRRERDVLAGDVNERLTSYIASITGQRVETSSSVREMTLARLIMPFAIGSCDILSGDIAVFRSTGVFEPHILAHEFCHRKGYLKELEAQALAYLALEGSRDPQLRQAALAAAVPHIAAGAWLAFALAGALAIRAWAYRGSRLGPALLVVGLVALVALDALRVDRVFVQTMDFHQWAAPGANIRAVLERERGNDEPYRMLSLRRAGQDLDPVLSGIEMAAGHHPNDLARYRELIGMAGSGLPLNLLQSGNIRALLNVRYILWPDLAMGQSPAGPVLSRTQTPDGRTRESVFEEAGLPRARLVGSAVVKTDEEAVPYMLSPDFDPEREVVLAEAPPLELDGGSVSGEVTWRERGPDRLRLEVVSERPALLVVADNWYPAWKARVNEESVPVMRAYHTLRAVPVPAGRAQVEMYYESGLLRWSFWLGIAVLLALLVANGVQFRRARSERSSA